MSLKDTFDQAVAESKQLATRPDNNTLLKLYSLYKQATDGDAPADGPSNMFDIVGRAKHSAWSQLKGLNADAAMQQYIDIVAGLKS